MEAFTYFFSELALWNILLATLAFLFGLLMGYWMWGLYRKKLVDTGRELVAKKEQNEKLAAELKEAQGALKTKSEEWGGKRKNLETELSDLKKALADKAKELTKALEKEKSVKDKPVESSFNVSNDVLEKKGAGLSQVSSRYDFSAQNLKKAASGRERLLLRAKEQRVNKRKNTVRVIRKKKLNGTLREVKGNRLQVRVTPNSPKPDTKSD